MKNSYKLLNINLDGLQLPTVMPNIYEIKNIEAIFNLCDPYNLMDLIFKKRKISGNLLLSTQYNSHIFTQVENLEVCKQIIIILDFKSSFKVINILYVKRILQFYNLLLKKYPGIQFALTCSSENMNHYKSIINSIYFS